MRSTMADEKRICLITNVLGDGIGDLIHQIRMFELLNKIYPGRVDCYTYAEGGPDHTRRVVEVAAEYEFKTQLNPEDQRIFDDPTKYALGIIISKPPHREVEKIRTYKISEIGGAGSAKPDWVAFGLPPNGIGIWHDTIPLANDRAGLLKNSSELQEAFGCTEADLQTWLDTAWISQSFDYGEDSFVMTLLAQLEYIQNKKLPIEHVFIKFFGKNRANKLWDIKNLLNEDKYRQAFSRLNVKSILIDNEILVINDKNTIELRMSSKRISSKSYPIFQQLINGVVIPAGDNSYSEALSNPNTTLPPFLMPKAYSNEFITCFRMATDSVNLTVDQRRCLNAIIDESMTVAECGHTDKYVQDIYKQYEECGFSTKGLDLKPVDLLEKVHNLAKAWSELDSPHEVWLAVYEEMKKYDLSLRLPAIIAEQLLLASIPEQTKQAPSPQSIKVLQVS